MKSLVPSIAIVLSLFCSLPSFSQTSLQGVINSYSPVTSIDWCNNTVAASNPIGFMVGDRVLLIQMKGVTIDDTDAASFGTITDYANAGNFEVLTIEDINFNIVTFTETMLRRYDNDGFVQIVTIPQYTDVTIDSTLTARDWDGSSGGILAMEASGTVTFNSDINVTGKGFRGGGLLNNAGCYGAGAGYDGYRCAEADECGAEKGEGIIGDVSGIESVSYTHLTLPTMRTV